MRFVLVVTKLIDFQSVVPNDQIDDFNSRIFFARLNMFNRGLTVLHLFI